MNFGLHAFSDDEDNKLISQALTISDPAVEKEPSKEKLEATEKEDSEIIEVKTNTKVDSSYYSVNKFNFVFYLMYKLKYLEEENVTLPKKSLKLE